MYPCIHTLCCSVAAVQYFYFKLMLMLTSKRYIIKRRKKCVIKIRINKYEYAMINNTNPFPSSSPNNPYVRGAR